MHFTDLTIDESTQIDDRINAAIAAQWPVVIGLVAFGGGGNRGIVKAWYNQD